MGNKLFLVCALVVILRYWVLYKHVPTSVPPYKPAKSGRIKLHSFTPHQKNQLTVAHLRVGLAKQPRDTDTLNTSIAIGMGITLKGIFAKHPTVSKFLQTLPFFSQLMPSFCKTASLGYRYSFYLAHDRDDKFFTNTKKVKIWIETFSNITQQYCQELGDVGLILIRCNHSGRPSWAQNDAMMKAHKDGRDFFYRVNDDSIMVTPDWTDMFIQTLQNMKPPLVGVVGPNHSGGNTAILTYDFVHRTHIDIFGYHYPRAFPWWYADDWITMVYMPGRSTKIDNVHLKHTMTFDTRYSYEEKSQAFINKIVKSTKEEKLVRYLNKMKTSTKDHSQQSVHPSPPPASGKTQPSTLPAPPLPSGSSKTPNSTLLVPSPSTGSGKTSNSTSLPSTLPPGSDKAPNSTLPESHLPSGNRETPNSTLPTTPLPPGHVKTPNSTLSESPLLPGSNKTPNSSIPESSLHTGSGKTFNSTLPESPLPPGFGRTANATLPISPLPPGFGKTPNSTPLAFSLPPRIDKTPDSTLPISPLPPGFGKTLNSTLLATSLPSQSGETPNSTLPASSLFPGSGKPLNSTLLATPLFPGSGKTPNSTSLPSAPLPGSEKTSNYTPPISPLLPESGRTPNSTLPASPLLSGSGKTPNSTLPKSPLLTGNGKTANFTLPASPLFPGTGKTPNANLPESPLPPGSGKTSNSKTGLLVSSLPLGSVKTDHTTLMPSKAESSKARKNSDYIPSSQPSDTKKDLA